VRRTEDTQGNFISIVHFGAEHELEIRDETVFDETPVELFGIWRNECKIVANTDLVVVVSLVAVVLTIFCGSEKRVSAPDRSMSLRSTRRVNTSRGQ
jgi:hypothetical protein